MVKIAPSILSANFSKLGREIHEVEEAGCDYIHVDVMDGHFVPDITIGPLVVEAIKPVTRLPLDVHLMIERPDEYIDSFIEAGASYLTVHLEACTHLHRTVQTIQSQGINAGVAINPSTPVDLLKEIIYDLDLIVVMTVNPGFGGQSFIPSTLEKIKQLDAWRKEYDLTYEIEVDGGVNAKTAKQCADAGADILVAGSAIFQEKDRVQAIHQIRKALC